MQDHLDHSRLRLHVQVTDKKTDQGVGLGLTLREF